MIEVAVTRRYPPGPDSAGFHLAMHFEAAAGVTVLYGPSGAGKTLTLDCIAGFVIPDTGRILLDDRILFDAQARVNLRPQLRGCGYVFQNYALFPNMTLRQNLAFAAHGLPRLERHRRIGDLLDRFRLTDLAGRYPRELSGGQKQRGSIARALIAQPKALLLDEPARGLDASLRADLNSVVLDIKQSLKTPMLLVTHDLEECLAIADIVLIVEAGAVVHRSTPLDLLRNPGGAAVARLLGGFNIYEVEVLSLNRIRLFGQEMDGPQLRGCFKGDRVSVCARPEELRLVNKPGDNRIRVTTTARITERPQSIRADYGNELVVDVPREAWAAKSEDVWIEIPAAALRQLKT